MYAPPLNIRYARRAADALGFAHESADPVSDYLLRISNGAQSCFVGAGLVHGYPINLATPAGIATDKTHCYRLLERLGIRVPASRLVFIGEKFADLRPAGMGLADAKAFAAAQGYPLFVKPNAGSRGVLAQSVADEAALERQLAAIAAASGGAVVQARLNGGERRIFAIDGVPVFAYDKTRPVLHGDGLRTIEALLGAVDVHCLRNGLSPVNRDDPVLAESLAAHDFGFASVPPAGLAIPYSEKANVSGGGGVTGLTEQCSAFEADLCRRIHEGLGLRVLAIDTLIEPGADEAESIVLEVNANPSLTSLEAQGREDLLLRIWTDVLVRAIG